MKTIPSYKYYLPGYIGPGPRDGIGGCPGGPLGGTDALGGPLGLDVGGPPVYMPPPEPGGGIGPPGDAPPAYP